jgi:hypothetical protein
VIAIEGVSAERVLAEWDETESAESRSVVGEGTGPGLDVGADERMREAEDGESSVIVPAI